jgi:hypothetical protein
MLIEVKEFLMADSKVKRRQRMPRRVSDAEFEKIMVKFLPQNQASRQNVRAFLLLTSLMKCRFV